MLIFELDGGSWDVIDPLLEEGRLPHIAALVRRGVRGSLRSIPPLISPAVWTTIYTGQPREKHGVLGFDATSQEVRYDRLWDIAHAHGVDCGVCGSLVTWPPYDVGGFMIPDIMARDSKTLPPQVAPLQDLVLNYPRGRSKSKYGLAAYARYGVALSRVGVGVRTMLALAREVLTSRVSHRPYRDTYWRRALLLQSLYADAFVRLYRTRRPGLATYHYHAVDTLSHRYWREYETGDDAYQEVIPAAYEAADRVLGRLLRVVGPEASVLVLSDHGFCNGAAEQALYTARLDRWIQLLGLEGTVTPTRLGRQHFLYFRDTSRMEEVGEKLQSTTFKETGASVFPRVAVRDGSSLFFLPPRTHSEGLTVVIPNHAELPFEELFKDTGHIQTGVHDPKGVAVLAGPSVQRGVQLEEASILDVVPTVLALLGLPVARDMTGRVWTEAIRAEFLEEHPVSFVDTYRREEAGAAERTDISEEDREVLYQRLRDLGYL